MLVGFKNIDINLIKEEKEYLRSNMKDSLNNEDVPTGLLTRIKSLSYINNITSGKIKEGGSNPSNSEFKSFSRTPKQQ